jgi:hypothetical protein
LVPGTTTRLTPTSVLLHPADTQTIEAGGKTIIVESDGTIIIGAPDAVARAQSGRDVTEAAAPETVEVEYLTGGC